MIQPGRRKLVTLDEDAIEVIVWTDVPPEEIQKINGVYEAYGTCPMVIRCDPRYDFNDIDRAIDELAEEWDTAHV